MMQCMNFILCMGNIVSASCFSYSWQPAVFLCFGGHGFGMELHQTVVRQVLEENRFGMADL